MFKYMFSLYVPIRVERSYPLWYLLNYFFPFSKHLWFYPDFILLFFVYLEFLICYKGILVSFYQLFYGKEKVGRILWNNGTQSEFKQNDLHIDEINENSDETESGNLHSVISYMV